MTVHFDHLHHGIADVIHPAPVFSSVPQIAALFNRRQVKWNGLPVIVCAGSYKGYCGSVVAVSEKLKSAHAEKVPGLGSRYAFDDINLDVSLANMASNITVRMGICDLRPSE